MKKEYISDKQGISIIFLFLTGSTSIFVSGLEAKKDLWIAFILSMLMVLPLVIVYARLHFIFPDKDLFDILEICFGKFIGKIMIILYTWFGFFFASDICVNYGQFISEVTLLDTPKIIPIIVLCLLCVWCIKEGIELMGRWSEFFMIILTILLFIMVMFTIPNMNINNLRPVLYKGIKPVFKGAFSAFTFPLVQIVVFTMAFSSFRRKRSPYKVYIIGLLIGGLYIAIVSITNILVLGVDTATSAYYPVHSTATRINIGNILQRSEVIVFISFVLGGVIKISILLLCICKGTTKLFGFRNYKFIIIPISLLVINLSYFQYESIMYYFEFNTEIWPYYNFPFEVILPIIIWITAEIKKKRLTTIQ